MASAEQQQPQGDEAPRAVDAPDEGAIHDGSARLTRVWTAIKLIVGVGVVVVASSGMAWGAYQFFITTPRFAIQRVEVDGSHRRSDDQILAVAGIQRGQNLFATDLAKAEQQLLADPWVNKALVTRRLPNTLVIELSEYRASAVAIVDGRLLLVSEEGIPFKQATATDPYDLPMLTGVSGSDLARDRDGAIDRFRDGIEVLTQYARIPMSRVHVAQEVHLAPDGSLVLSVGTGGMTLHLGKAPWRKRLLMGARIVGQLQGHGTLPGILFLDNSAHPERVVVRMR